MAFFSPLTYTGDSTYALELTRELIRDKWDVDFIVFKQNVYLERIKEDLERNYKLKYVPKMTFPILNNISPFINTPKYYNYFKKYDIIHSQSAQFHPLASKIKTKLKKPVIISNHWYPLYNRIFMGDLSDRMNYIVTRLALHRILKVADALIVPCQYIKDKIKALYKKIPIYVQHNAVNSEIFSRLSLNKKEELKRTMDYAGKTLIGFVGQINPYKGLHILLDSLKYIVKERKNILLLVIGGLRGGYANRDYPRLLKNIVLKEQLTKYVKFLGKIPQSDLLNHYKIFDLFVLPSLFDEYQPIAVLEAMASGVPVAASRTEGIPETVFHEKNGLIFERNDSQDLAKKILFLLNNPDLVATFVRRNLDQIKTKYTWKNVATRFQKIVQTVLEEYH